ncbi:DUF3140 domain-containing protein [Amycolatopsis endophytica]|uniref:DNA-binding protein n=1 Tax=Amycolatopsis endophytica TaxID=860233 RepID=A0A853BE05_9PSEU|nr:DUF3140 domain-containing protein [Amycolatopsis endophytica]NYI92827.1 hypothetical protein [Amycolatopsis endophytica]
MDDKDEDETWKQFQDEVNTSARQLEGGGESVGHESGRHIVRILRSKRSDLSAEDYKHMRKMLGFIHRHSAQKPSGEVKDTRWRYSLMNRGHDPLK